MGLGGDGGGGKGGGGGDPSASFHVRVGCFTPKLWGSGG